MNVRNEEKDKKKSDEETDEDIPYCFYSAYKMFKLH